LIEHALVDVGRVDARALIDARFLQHDGGGENFFAGGAAGVPNAKARVGFQDRHHAMAQGREEARVAKHRGHVNRQVAHQALEELFVAQHAALQFGDGGAVFPPHALQDAAPQRPLRVAAVVELVAREERVQQRRDFDLLDRRLAHR